mmetsp:Transcript_21858/g.85617  ORF Transcript_21858/g.85617 Transcript_21858/m.85617 type:complete len:615 (-) Transcript_21858:2229-4073(-)
MAGDAPAGDDEALVPQPEAAAALVPEHLPASTRKGSKKSSVYGVRGSPLAEADGAVAVAAAGGGAAGEELPPISSQEVVRLMLQALEALGLRSSAAELERESGVSLETPEVGRFRAAVLAGEWELVDRLLGAENVLCFPSAECAAWRKVDFLVARQRYLELLEAGAAPAALAVLRSRLMPVSAEISAHSAAAAAGAVAREEALAEHVRPHSEPLDYGRALRQLSSWFSCSSPAALRKEAKWAGVDGGTREELLYQIHDYVPAGVMMPEHRLSTLLRQAVLQQERNCPLHNAVTKTIGLLEDHCCTASKLPKEPRAILKEHGDEVWVIEFSHCGTRLASASTDGYIIIWDVSDDGLGAMHQRFQPNSDVCVISFVAWSPADQQMLVCSRGEVILWDVLYGKEVRRFSVHALGGTMHTVAWSEDGESFYCAGSEKFVKKVSIATGEATAIWPTPCVVDMAISRDRSSLVVACQDKLVVIIDLETGSMESFKESVTLTSLTLSNDHCLAALHMTNQEIHVWDLRTKIMVQKFSHAANDAPLYYVIRPSFGGANEALLLCGSECGDIHVWHREQGKMIEVIKGHTKMVNSVCWNPMRPHMFASASDDGTVRIWTTEGL